ncbi:MAG: phage terminase large subunit [Marinovum algicola]
MSSPSDAAALTAALRSDLTAFIAKCVVTVAPGSPYRPNWHIEAIAHALTRCRDGATTRLVVTQPPRSLKSIATSVAFVAWVLGHDPTRRIICVSYSQDLANELARQFRLVVTSAWYRALFPAMRLARETGAEVITTRGGSRLATSIGGTLTGRGADLILLDDPLKAEDAASQNARRRVRDWYTSTLATRLDDKRRGVIVLIMQRLHEDDLAGHLLAAGGWAHLDLPAIAPEAATIRLGPRPQDIHYRAEGDVLHPARERRATLDRIKAEIGSLAFSAQYQQRPVPLEGNLVRRSWLGAYDIPPAPGPGVRIVQSWDIATTASDTADWSVCTTWAIVGRSYSLLDVWRDRLEFPDLRRRVVALQQAHGASTVLIEDAGLGKGLVQDLRADGPRGFPKPIAIKPTGDKLTRLEAASAIFEEGRVLLPRDAPWLGTFLDELFGFPNARHDDQVDSVSQFLGWARSTAAREVPLVMPPALLKPPGDSWFMDDPW